jgi:hypothetical protein
VIGSKEYYVIIADVNAPADLSLDRELLLQPFPIISMFPERTELPIQGRMVALFPLGGGTVNAVSVVHFLSGNDSGVGGFAMRPPA